jgi:hypothetical protein
MSVLWAGQVADFGLSRHSPNKHTVATRTCGGVTHAAPELIREGRLSPAIGVPFATSWQTGEGINCLAFCRRSAHDTAFSPEPSDTPAVLATKGSRKAPFVC